MQREPVITAASIIGLIQAGIVMAISFGWIDMTAEQQSYLYAFLAALLALALPVLGAWYARGKVTPLVDPKDADGMPLTGPNGEPTQAQARSGKVSGKGGY